MEIVEMKKFLHIIICQMKEIIKTGRHTALTAEELHLIARAAAVLRTPAASHTLA